MKPGLRDRWQRPVLVVALTAAALLGATPAQAQPASYQVGDRVACDYTQTGRFERGTIIPFMPTDLDKSGRWYRVHIDGWTPDGRGVECMGTHLRPLTEEAAPATSGSPMPAPAVGSTGAVAHAPAAAAYRPGDRVECDRAQSGRWEKGTVLHFLQNDLDKASGRYYRVRLDEASTTLYPAGHECMADFMRPLSEPGLQPSGRYRVGDRVDAHAYSSAWLPATIVAIDGAFYRVQYDGYDSRHDEMVDDRRLRPIGAGAAATAPGPATNDAAGAPTMQGDLPVLPGTAWKVMFYSRGETPPDQNGRVAMVMLFCRSGSWDTVRYGLTPGAAGAVGQRGTYQVSGSQVTLINGTDGGRSANRMRWIAAEGALDLDDGSGLIMRLRYNGQTTCN